MRNLEFFNKQFLSFFIVGIIVSLFNLFSLYLLVSILSIEKNIIAPTIALELSILLSFYLNNKYTFKNEKNLSKKDSIFLKIGKFHLAAFSGFILNLILYNFFLKFFDFLILPNFILFYIKDYIIAQILAILIVFFWNYYVNSNWTWKS